MTRTTRITAGLGALVLGATALVGGVLPTAVAATPYHHPTAQPLPDPGVVRTSSGTWVVLSTGSWKGLHVGTAGSAAGHYTVKKRALLTRRPAWMSTKDASVWAPSLVEFSAGHFAVYYAGVVKGTSGRRCIGSATGTVATGPFRPSDRPIACWTGSGTRAHDSIGNEGGRISLIDPTPAAIDGGLVLTYKTEYRKPGSRIWHTTTRLVAIDSADPTRTGSSVHPSVHSIRISDSRSPYIEENPVLVRHGSRYTLFTSFGWFGTCVYTTRYRQNDSLWSGWSGKKPHALTIKANTCGSGNAQVVDGPEGWRIFFNGHLDKTAKPTQQHHPRGPQGMYVGAITWSKGKPVFAGLL